MIKVDLPVRYRKTPVGRLIALLCAHDAMPYETALAALMPPLAPGVVPSRTLREGRRDNAQKALTRVKVLLRKHAPTVMLVRFKSETGAPMVALVRRGLEVGDAR